MQVSQHADVQEVPIQTTISSDELVTEKVTRSPNTIRNDIELVRVFAAFGVVWFHTGVTGHHIGYAGLIVFIILSLYLSGSGGQKTIYQRANRLLVPWAIWFAIYAASRVASGKPPVDMGLSFVEAVLLGSRSHLWYLPFILFALVCADIMVKTMNHAILAALSAVAACVMLLTAGLWREPSIAAGQPWAQYWHAGAAVFTGLYLYTMVSLPRIVRPTVLVVIMLCAATSWTMPGMGIPYVIGLAIAGLIAFNPWPGAIRSQPPLAQYTLGIYLAHPLVLTVMALIGIAEHWTAPVMAFFISAVGIAAFKTVAPRFAARAV